jgi:hypothetical protein
MDRSNGADSAFAGVKKLRAAATSGSAAET